MMCAVRKSLLLLVMVGLLSWGAAAKATPMLVTFDGTIASVPLALAGYIAVGDPFSVDMYVDSATPNEVAAPDFLATGPGTVHSFLIVDIIGTVVSVSATAGTGSWDSTGLLDILGTPVPYATSLTGAGLTPDQILPDFSSFTGGISIDLSALAPGSIVLADVSSITITAVPEPGTALLLLLGLSGLTAAGRRRSA